MPGIQIGVFEVKVGDLVSVKPNTAVRCCADFPFAVIKFWPNQTEERVYFTFLYLNHYPSLR